MAFRNENGLGWLDWGASWPCALVSCRGTAQIILSFTMPRLTLCVSVVFMCQRVDGVVYANGIAVQAVVTRECCVDHSRVLRQGCLVALRLSPATCWNSAAPRARLWEWRDWRQGVVQQRERLPSPVCLFQPGFAPSGLLANVCLASIHETFVMFLATEHCILSQNEIAVSNQTGTERMESRDDIEIRLWGRDGARL